MIKKALLVRLEAKRGKEKEVENFLKTALPLVEQEHNTISWYAFKLSDTTYGIFDTFPDEGGKQSHLAGKVAVALMAKAPGIIQTKTGHRAGRCISL